MRVVLDTNVLVSGLLWYGPPHDLIERAREGRLSIVSSTALLREFSSVISRRKFRTVLLRSGTDAQRLQREMQRLVEIVDAPLVRPTSRDPDDDVVLAVAVAARADLIVSGDRDLLMLRSHAGIAIVNPAAALERTS